MRTRTQRLVELLSGPRRQEIVEAFEQCVAKAGSDECWEWTGKRNFGGYGSFLYPSVSSLIATRAAWLIYRGPFDERLMMLHSCDNPPCVNPDHLRPGNRRENAFDMIARPGRKRIPKRPRKPHRYVNGRVMSENRNAASLPLTAQVLAIPVRLPGFHDWRKYREFRSHNGNLIRFPAPGSLDYWKFDPWPRVARTREARARESR